METKEVCTATIKLTEHEIGKLIWCIKSIHNVLKAFEIKPDEEWIITLDTILEDMEKIANDIKEEKEKRVIDKKTESDPKKEYINKIAGEKGS